MTKWTPGRCPWPGHQFISASLVGFDFAAMKDLFVDFCIVAPDGGLANSVHRLVTLTKYPEKGCCSFALRELRCLRPGAVSFSYNCCLGELASGRST